MPLEKFPKVIDDKDANKRPGLPKKKSPKRPPRKPPFHHTKK